MSRKPAGTREICVGEGLEIDNGFTGTIQKKLFKSRIEAMRVAVGVSEIFKDNDDTVGGLEQMLNKLGEIYPSLDLNYGSHHFSSIGELYETDKGEELITKVLIPGIAGAMPLSKN